MGALGLDLGRAGRVTLMNEIGMALGIPPGGWHGQARLFERDDIRLKNLFPMMVRARTAQLMAGNLERAVKYVQVNLMLVMVSAQREACRSLTATGDRFINTFHQGGLDFLDKLKAHLGLPASITDRWRPANPVVNTETGNEVYPEEIPSRDQLLAYGAAMSASFSHNFRSNLRAEFGKDADLALARASRSALLVWQAYAFLAPGGRPYDPKEPLRTQLNKHFGHRSALGFYAHRARNQGRSPRLDDVLTDHALEPLEWFHSSKTRAAEALFLGRLFVRARQIVRG
ncbi:MAG: hypothetical protein ABUS79_21830 [Pseudomonadota bacterium]